VEGSLGCPGLGKKDVLAVWDRLQSKSEKAMYNLVDDAWGKFVVNPEKITVPFLVMAGENELNGEGIRQAHEFYDKLGNSVKEKRIITTKECGEAHCQLNNFPLARQIIFDWIEDRMKDVHEADTEINRAANL